MDPLTLEIQRFLTLTRGFSTRVVFGPALPRELSAFFEPNVITISECYVQNELPQACSASDMCAQAELMIIML